MFFTQVLHRTIVVSCVNIRWPHIHRAFFHHFLCPLMSGFGGVGDGLLYLNDVFYDSMVRPSIGLTAVRGTFTHSWLMALFLTDRNNAWQTPWKHGLRFMFVGLPFQNIWICYSDLTNVRAAPTHVITSISNAVKRAKTTHNSSCNDNSIIWGYMRTAYECSKGNRLDLLCTALLNDLTLHGIEMHGSIQTIRQGLNCTFELWTCRPGPRPSTHWMFIAPLAALTQSQLRKGWFESYKRGHERTTGNFWYFW